MIILDGKLTAEKRQNLLKSKVQSFEQKYGRKPHLVVVLVGNYPPSEIYVKNKQAACERVGMTSTLVRLPSEISEAAFIATLNKINLDPLIDGILVQEPLPSQISRDLACQVISSDKDADGVTINSTGTLWSGQSGVAPCTPQGVMNLLKEYKIDVAGMNCVVLGRSPLVGKPMAALLLNANATVTILHSRSQNISQYTKMADLVVVATGQMLKFSKNDFKAGAIIVDVGIHRNSEGKIVGDVNKSDFEGYIKAVTPVPGGVGPMTIDTLIHNTFELALKSEVLKRERIN